MNINILHSNFSSMSQFFVSPKNSHMSQWWKEMLCLEIHSSNSSRHSSLLMTKTYLLGQIFLLILLV